MFWSRCSKYLKLCAYKNFGSAPKNLHLVTQVLPKSKVNFEPCLFIDAGVLLLKSLYYELLAHLMFEIRHGLRRALWEIPEQLDVLGINGRSYGQPGAPWYR